VAAPPVAAGAALVGCPRQWRTIAGCQPRWTRVEGTRWCRLACRLPPLSLRSARFRYNMVYSPSVLIWFYPLFGPSSDIFSVWCFNKCSPKAYQMLLLSCSVQTPIVTALLLLRGRLCLQKLSPCL
jgi:hypothetical protein